jgi:2'-5' RNA ligase
MRLFTAIELPLAVREHLTDVSAALLRGVIEHEVKWTPREQLHVTLKFFGEVPDARVPGLIDTLRAVTVIPASVFADRLLLFPARGPVRVVAAGLAGEVEQVAKLNSAIEQVAHEAGFEREARPYIPHITIGRNRRGRYQKVASILRTRPPVPVAWPGPVFRVSSFALVQSVLDQKGPNYVPIAHFRTDTVP